MTYKGQTAWENLSPSLQQKIENIAEESGKVEIVNDSMVGGADKVASAEVAKNLKNEVDEKANSEDLESLRTTTNEHLAEIATTESLGHIKPDGKTITVDHTTGVATANIKGTETRLFTGTDMNDLKESGYWYIPRGVTNTPENTNYFCEVIVAPDGNSVVQLLTYANTNSSQAPLLKRNGVFSVANNLWVWGDLGTTEPYALNGWFNATPIYSVYKTLAVTPVSGWEIADSGSLVIKKIYGVVHVRGYLKLTSTSSSRSIAFLPTGYSPVEILHTSMFGRKSGVDANIDISLDTSGHLSVDLSTPISQLTAGSNYSFEFSFLTNA